MENKEIVSSRKMSQLLTGYWLSWGILGGIIYSFLYSLITESIESIALKAIIAIVGQGIVVFFLWKLSTSSAFKNRTISKDDVPTVMRNLIIFTIVICVITSIYNISLVNSSIDKAINSNYQLQNQERLMSRLYSNEKLNEYNKEKEKIISDTKSKAYMYVTILEVGVTVVYLAVLPLEKKEILKHIS